MRIVVVGAGVIGSLAAIELARDGHEVRVVAERFGAETTSARAGASFKPSGVHLDARATALLRDSADLLRRWDGDGTSARRGVHRALHVEASDSPLGALPHLELMDEVTPLGVGGAEPAPGGFRFGVRYRTWLIDVPQAVASLLDEVADVAAEMVRGQLTSLDEVADGADVIVHAAGLGARELAHDPEVVAVRGQTVRVAPFTTTTPSTSGDGWYFYPRSDGVLLGGTSEPGVEDEHPDPDVADEIVRRNARVVPEVLGAERLEVSVGLRPLRRTGVRLEVERRRGLPPVVHAYGHGGSGWSLAPGTAAWTVEAVRSLDG